MAKPRSSDSLLTKLEEMKKGDEIFVSKSSSYVSDAIDSVRHSFPSRKYKQVTVYTHENLHYTSLKDFEKKVCIERLN